VPPWWRSPHHQGLCAQYAQWWAQAEAQAYYKLLQERFKAQIKVPRPAQALADPAANGAR